MNSLQAKWALLRDRFNAYSQRERGLLAGAAIGGVLLLGFSLLIDPNLARVRVLQKTADQARTELAAAQAQLQMVKAQLKVDPNASRRAEIAALKNDLASVDASLKKLENGLVAPEQMNALLERLLARHVSLKLLSFKSLTPTNLAEAVAEGDKSADGQKARIPSSAPGLYKHGVELRLEGSYSDLHAWVAQLEAAPQKVLWGDVRFVVAEYPRAVLTLTVYTLSLEKSWLAI
jgi:MSHA biogenesis protein MshJ